MSRGLILTLALICCWAPSAALAQNRAATFPRGAVKAVGAPFSVRTARGSFRGFRGALPFSGVGGLAYGYGYEQNLLYRLGRIPVPPYFALHPPVYYTEPIAVPYGASPYAREAGCYEAPVQSAVIVNPHIKKTPATEQKAVDRGKTVSNTKFILNPYCSPPQVELATKE